MPDDQNTTDNAVADVTTGISEAEKLANEAAEDFQWMRDWILLHWNEVTSRDARFNNIGEPPWLKRPTPNTQST